MPERTGKNIAFHEMFLSLGNATGSFGDGFIFQYFGINSTFLMLALILTADLVLQILLDHKS
jgi:predicted MFS family arabinose efflux permease